MRHQSLSKHLLRNFTRFLRRFDDVDAALESVFKGPLPSPTGVDLRFDRQSAIRTDSSCGEINISEFTRDCFSFVGRPRMGKSRRRPTKLKQSRVNSEMLISPQDESVRMADWRSKRRSTPVGEGRGPLKTDSRAASTSSNRRR